MKISESVAGPDDAKRIEEIATVALPPGATGDERTWLEAVRKAQPRFDWSTQPIIKAQYSLWLDKTWRAAFKQHFDKDQRIWKYARDSPQARRCLQIYRDDLLSILQGEQELGLNERFQVFSDATWKLRGVGCFNQGHICLVFRGTANWRNWVLNLRAGVKQPGVHSGFLSAWQILEPQVRTWLAELPQKSAKVTVTGHSLGGAIAILAAYSLHKDFDIEGVVTFGSPRLAQGSFAKLYAQVGLGSVTRRYIHATDLVSSIIPETLYMHAGKEFFVTASGAIAEQAPEPTFQRLHRDFQEKAIVAARNVAGPFLNPVVAPLGNTDRKSWFRGSLISCRQLFVDAITSHPAFVMPTAAGLGLLFGTAYIAARSGVRIRSLWIDKGEHDMKKYQHVFEQLSLKWFGNLKLNGMGQKAVNSAPLIHINNELNAGNQESSVAEDDKQQHQ